MIKMLSKFRSSYLGIALFASASIFVGLQMLISPENVSPWFLRAVGFLWFLEGVHLALEGLEKYLKTKV